MLENTLPHGAALVNSKFCLRPLYEALKQSIEEGNPGTEKLYGNLLRQIAEKPELLEPVAEFDSFRDDRDLLFGLFATLFPPQDHLTDNRYAIAYPFRFKTVYASRLFRDMFLCEGTEEISIPETVAEPRFLEDKIRNAYDLILNKCYGMPPKNLIRTVYPFIDPASRLTRYIEIKIDARYVDVRSQVPLPELGSDIICRRTNRILQMDDLQKRLPLSQFVFEGLVILRTREVTDQVIIDQIRNRILDFSFNEMDPESNHQFIQERIQNLLGNSRISIGVTPLFKVNDQYINRMYNPGKSMLFSTLSKASDCQMANACFTQLFSDINEPVLFESITPEDPAICPYVDDYKKLGVESLMISPLKKDNRLLGVLEISSPRANDLNRDQARVMEELLPLFSIALQKTAEALESQVDRVIKEKFTAIQPSVEWKFTEVALEYILARKLGNNVPVPRIAFEQVYPLYGAVDIRNSSVERAQSVQLDIIEQLQMAGRIVRKAQQQTFFPLLQEIEFKIEKYLSVVSDNMLSEEEFVINEFLQQKVTGLFDHLGQQIPGLLPDIESYRQALEPQLGMIYRHRKDFDDSIAIINNRLSRFVDAEQVSAQRVYPHYFERYLTDGVEFNIYIGQSLAPKQAFDDLYLRNMKMWQLATLARAARLTRELEKELPHTLQTTQLILAHSLPISISFRAAERKFDVDGAYNIRYEIIKKRIDKVRIKATGERLTQAGKIAIVYSQSRESAEYREYIEFYQNQKLLAPGVEEFELEDLQGVVGLKALRVAVNFETEETAKPAIELSSTTSENLLRS